MIRISKRFQEAAQRILDGDESKIAAAALEGVLLDEHLGEEDMEDLLSSLLRFTRQATAPSTTTAPNFEEPSRRPSATSSSPDRKNSSNLRKTGSVTRNGPTRPTSTRPAAKVVIPRKC